MHHLSTHLYVFCEQWTCYFNTVYSCLFSPLVVSRQKNVNMNDESSLCFFRWVVWEIALAFNKEDSCVSTPVGLCIPTRDHWISSRWCSSEEQTAYFLCASKTIVFVKLAKKKQANLKSSTQEVLPQILLQSHKPSKNTSVTVAQINLEVEDLSEHFPPQLTKGCSSQHSYSKLNLKTVALYLPNLQVVDTILNSRSLNLKASMASVQFWPQQL